MIKTIIFDLGKVIVPFDFGRAYEAIAPLCDLTPAEIPARLRDGDLVNRFESGLIEPRPFVQAFAAQLDLDIGYEDFCGIWSCIFLPHTLIPESLLAGLHERYRLLLLSNTNAIHFEMVAENYPLLRHFDEYILSYKVGAMKPSTQIYEAALAKAQCRPEECFFTDDIPAYVEGAKKQGIDAVQFQSADQIETELRARGVIW
ncbi:MAG: HAD family phosphatase [Bryobacteraceae bacterium]